MFVVGGCSEKGDYRNKNQDRALAYVSGQGNFAVGLVCDGIGSFQNSEISSEIMVRGIQNWCEGMEKMYPGVYEDDDVADDMEETIKELNELVCDKRAALGEDIGCTMSMIVTVGNRYHIFHVGDSRVYKVGDETVQVTVDEVAMKEKDGRIKSFLANYVGKNRELWFNRYDGDIVKNDIFVVCSDGLYKRDGLENLEINEVYKAKGAKTGEVCRKLVRMVYDRGEKDNVSCVIVADI